MLRRLIQRFTPRPLADRRGDRARAARPPRARGAESLASGARPPATRGSRRDGGSATSAACARRCTTCGDGRGSSSSTQDVRHGARAMVRSPAYSVAIVMTLAMGIGAAERSTASLRAIHTPFPAAATGQAALDHVLQRACASIVPRCHRRPSSRSQQRAPALTAIGVSGWNRRFGTAGGQ